MKILFDKIGQSGKPFHKELDGIVFDGILQKSGYHRITLTGDMDGSVEVQCSRCSASLSALLPSPLKLTISDQIVEDKDDLDIIEFLDGEIDISFIIRSEINSLKSEYHYCDQCDNGEEAFEMEF
ncbi:MAG: hypothetical protein U9R27_00435 [Campylobacterota bacterium]|nr:hypothetical protein [Campylobacterota bacterium]